MWVLLLIGNISLPAPATVPVKSGLDRAEQKEALPAGLGRW